MRQFDVIVLTARTFADCFEIEPDDAIECMPRCYLPALNLTVLSWWNRVFDSRGAVNSHILLRNEMRLDLVWAVFKYKFADLAGHHEKPIVGRTY